ncbi:hypothetical protein BGX38DRAFT_1120220 [Terfezia claveryi]|nr:hypothetical protein BGX38DRAFT_1120220 [Terfezia claveryi]
MPDDNSKKRSAPGDGGHKCGKKGRYFSDKAKFHQTLTGIETGTQGVFATCIKGKEARCVGELYSLFDKYSEKLYGPFEKGEAAGNDTPDDNDDDDDDGEMDIEAMMAKELDSMRNTGKKGKQPSNADNALENKMFVSVKLDTQCVLYFRTNPPINPSNFVHAICSDFAASGTKQSRYTSRLTPIERTGKATVEGIEEVAMHVLKPHFHEGQEGVRFAIRPSLRHHDVLTRDVIIKTVARCVGLQHKVDLKNYDVLILVEVYKNMCGISVVKDWEKLKRFNLEQIQQIRIENKEGGITSPNVAKDSAPKPGPQKEARLEVTKTETEDQQEDPSELVLFSALPAPETTPKAGNHNGGASEENLASGTECATRF